MDFALEYIEKFIQVPFQMPSPTPKAMTRYVTSIAYPLFAKVVDTADETSPLTSSDSFWVDVGKDSARVLELCVDVAPLFGNNPRRVKQFLNVFRLQTILSHERGLFGEPRPSYQRLTLAKLARFTAVILRYPGLVTDLRDSPKLLTSIQQHALDQPNTDISLLPPLLARYLGKAELVEFLGNNSPMNARLNDLDVESLLRTVPAVVRKRPVEDEFSSSTSPPARPKQAPPFADPIEPNNADAAQPGTARSNAEPVRNRRSAASEATERETISEASWDVR